MVQCVVDFSYAKSCSCFLPNSCCSDMQILWVILWNMKVYFSKCWWIEKMNSACYWYCCRWISFRLWLHDLTRYSGVRMLILKILMFCNLSSLLLGLSFHYCTALSELTSGVNWNGHTIFDSVLELNCRLKCCQVEVCYFLHAWCLYIVWRQLSSRIAELHYSIMQYCRVRVCYVDTARWWVSVYSHLCLGQVPSSKERVLYLCFIVVLRCDRLKFYLFHLALSFMTVTVTSQSNGLCPCLVACIVNFTQHQSLLSHCCV